MFRLTSQKTAATLDVIGLLAFSHGFKAINSLGNTDINTEAMEAADRLFRMVSLRINIPPPIRKFFGLDDVSGRKYLNVIHRLLLKSIESKKAATERCKSDATIQNEDTYAKWDREKHMDFLDRLLENAGDGTEQFTQEEILDEMVIFFFAGHE